MKSLLYVVDQLGKALRSRKSLGAPVSTAELDEESCRVIIDVMDTNARRNIEALSIVFRERASVCGADEPEEMHDGPTSTGAISDY